MSAGQEYFCYTDGSCKASPGAPGGWGYIVKSPDGVPIEGYGKASGTLAKVMEYRAVEEVLKVLPDNARAVIFSDNQSLVENLSKQLPIWVANGFGKVDPLILSSVKSIAGSIGSKQLAVRFQWVRAHASNVGNERADALAAQGAREAKAELARADSRKRK